MSTAYLTMSHPALDNPVGRRPTPLYDIRLRIDLSPVRKRANFSRPLVSATSQYGTDTVSGFPVAAGNCGLNSNARYSTAVERTSGFLSFTISTSNSATRNPFTSWSLLLDPHGPLLSSIARANTLESAAENTRKSQHAVAPAMSDRMRGNSAWFGTRGALQLAPPHPSGNRSGRTDRQIALVARIVNFGHVLPGSDSSIVSGGRC